MPILHRYEFDFEQTIDGEVVTSTEIRVMYRYLPGAASEVLACADGPGGCGSVVDAGEEPELIIAEIYEKFWDAKSRTWIARALNGVALEATGAFVDAHLADKLASNAGDDAGAQHMALRVEDIVPVPVVGVEGGA